jgi:hypothetical protein
MAEPLPLAAIRELRWWVARKIGALLLLQCTGCWRWYCWYCRCENLDLEMVCCFTSLCCAAPAPVTPLLLLLLQAR